MTGVSLKGLRWLSCLSDGPPTIEVSHDWGLPRIHFEPPPRLLIDFKNSKWLTYFCILLCICYCFSHLIGLLSVTWLSLLYKFTRFLNLFSVSLWRRANARPKWRAKTLDYPTCVRIGSTPTFLHFDLRSSVLVLVNIWSHVGKVRQHCRKSWVFSGFLPQGTFGGFR